MRRAPWSPNDPACRLSRLGTGTRAAKAASGLHQCRRPWPHPPAVHAASPGQRAPADGRFPEPPESRDRRRAQDCCQSAAADMQGARVAGGRPRIARPHAVLTRVLRRPCCQSSRDTECSLPGIYRRSRSSTSSRPVRFDFGTPHDAQHIPLFVSPLCARLTRLRSLRMHLIGRLAAPLVGASLRAPTDASRAAESA